MAKNNAQWSPSKRNYMSTFTESFMYITFMEKFQYNSKPGNLWQRCTPNVMSRE